MGRAVATIIILLATLISAQAQVRNDPPRASFEDLWDDADRVHTDGDYPAAEQRYRALLIEYPESQRAALRVAVTMERQGRTQAAVSSYEDTISMDPESHWAAVGMFFKARALANSGQSIAAVAECARLEQLQPDSAYVARTNLLRAQVQRSGVAAAEAQLQRELEAGEILDAARSDSDTSSRMAACQDIIARYPGTGTSLRAKRELGHLLIREERFSEALDCFLELVNLTSDSPQAPAFQEACERVAAIHHVLGDRNSAFTQYMTIAGSSEGPIQEASAMTLGAGVLFEILQRRVMRSEPVSTEAWNEMRDLMLEATRVSEAPASLRVRADLMILESYAWEGDSAACLEFGSEFLEVYDPAAFEVEVTTAHHFLGAELMKLERYTEALEHFRWVLERYDSRDEIWPGMDHVPKSQFYAWRSLLLSGADAEAVREAAQALIQRFPDSPYSLFVQMEAARGGSWTDGIEPPDPASIEAITVVIP